jgi:hypothetical protein
MPRPRSDAEGGAAGPEVGPAAKAYELLGYASGPGHPGKLVEGASAFALLAIAEGLHDVADAIRHAAQPGNGS